MNPYIYIHTYTYICLYIYTYTYMTDLDRVDPEDDARCCSEGKVLFIGTDSIYEDGYVYMSI